MPVERYRSLGEAIRSQRKNKGLTQQELGEQIGTDYTHISKWERNKNVPGKENLQKLSEVLHIPLPMLLKHQRLDEVRAVTRAAEPYIEYGDPKQEAIKNLEAIMQLAKMTIEKLKDEEDL